MRRLPALLRAHGVIGRLRKNFLRNCLTKGRALAQESHGMRYPRNTKTLIYVFSLVVTGLCSGVYSTNAQVNVTQFHNHDSRDGLYIDSAFTQDAAANLARDLNFDGTISGMHAHISVGNLRSGDESFFLNLRV
jgi:hypothetical protein